MIMKKNDFYTRFIDFLEVDSVSSVDESTKLKDLAEYDSFFVLAIVAFVDENFSKNLTSKQLYEIENLGELMALIGNEKFVD
jgi:acyl carrier protein